MEPVDWVGIVVVVAGAAASSIALIYKMSMQIHRDMVDLDLRWQNRTEALAKDIRLDIKDVKDSIPPDWFREMVERNTERITHLEHRIEEALK